MIKTPTYHVFNMYKYHQDAELLESYVETEEIGSENNKVPNLHESVSLGKDGRIHVTLNNLSVSESYDIEAVFTETDIKGVEGAILTGEMQAHNTFENPDAVHTEKFDKVEIAGQNLKFTIPACSVLHLAIEV